MVWHLYVLSFHFMMLGLSYKFSNYQFAGYQHYISQSLFCSRSEGPKFNYWLIIG